MVKEVSIGFPVGSINGVLTTVLLGVRQRGIATGLWMPYGGEVEPGETPLACCIRELEEECGLACVPEDTEFAGVMNVSYSSTERRFHIQSQMRISMYLIHDWVGQLRDSVEMKQPKFFPLRRLPANMLEGNARVLRRIVAGRTVDADMTYQVSDLALTSFSMSDRFIRFPHKR